MSGGYSQRPQGRYYPKTPSSVNYKPDSGRFGQSGYGGQKRAWSKGGSVPYKQNYSNVYNQYSGTGGKHFDSSLQLWMGDLDPSWDENSVKKIWTSFGESPVSVKIMKDKGQNPKLAKPNYCFVSFSTQKDVASAMSKNGLQIPGSTKVLKLNWASGNNGIGNSANGQISSGSIKGNQKQEYSIFVGDLSPESSDSDLLELFSEKYSGQVMSAKVMFDPISKISKGFGFVRFKNQVTQQKALGEMSGSTLNGRAIRVGLAASSGASMGKDAGSETKDVQNITINQIQPPLNQNTDPYNTTLMVKGLASRFTEDELALHFISFGDIVYCKLNEDYNIGHIKFLSRASAEAALFALSNCIINDCYLHITWGKSNFIESDRLNFEPNQGKEYIKAIGTPKYYGAIDGQNLRLDKLDKKEIKNLQLIEESEPLSINKANEMYINSKLKRDSLLESLIL